ncbi:MAG: SUMF1/EgtB/PvdO family nonheme iron enzyme [bacterium]|nr:SUMF1/EgtB/PvdO family nonheme iron enzyme [bacterium]
MPKQPDRHSYRVFISSTFVDNQARRKIIEDAVLRANMQPVGMERFTADTDPTPEACVRMAEEADLLVGVLAWRYGWTPDGDGPSITEMEYYASREQLMFVMDGKGDSDEDFDEGPDKWLKQHKLEQFKQRVQRDGMPGLVTDATLGVSVLDALHRWRDKRERADAASPPRQPGGGIQSYLETVASQHDSIEIAGFDSKLRVPIKIEDLCVSLSAALDRSIDGNMRRWGTHELGEGDNPSEDLSNIPLNEAFAWADHYGERRGIVILGDPGSGKTTHLRRMALAAASDSPSRLELPQEVVPVFLPLRDLENVDAGIDAFVQSQIDANKHLRAKVPPGFGTDLVKRGKLLLLLDGLDEVAGTRAREDVVRWVEDALRANTDSYFVVTCRYAGYRALKEQFSAQFLELHLRPLDEEQAARFVHNWFRIVETGFAADRERAAREAADQADDLLARLKAKRSDTRVFEMTRNPLLLTGLCLVHRDRGQLPEKRATLYHEATGVLLERWREHKNLEVDLDADTARRLLQPVAHWLHSEEKRTRASAAELEPIVGGALASLGLAERSAKELLERIRDESGLLTGWGQDSFGFLHLGFQEFLAARHIANRYVAQPELLEELAGHFGESWWREVTLLLLALPDVPLFGPLMRIVVGSPAFVEHEDLVQQCVEHALEVTWEPFFDFLGITDPEALQERDRVALRILKKHDSEALEGFLFEQLGDDSVAIVATRETSIPIEAHNGHDLVRIPAGTFLMGENEEQHEVELAEFHLATHPVTNEQYARFLKANPDASEPEVWGDSRYNQPNQPVVGVSWDEANAYCDWAGLVLPTEAQWERACRAETTTTYWSGDDEADLDRVGWYGKNSGGRLHPVAEKPPNPFGLYDVHGNVWEWCLDWYGGYEKQPRPGDGARHLEGGSHRVYRGGSFADGALLARSAYRYYAPPGSRLDALGFRPAKAHS